MAALVSAYDKSREVCFDFMNLGVDFKIIIKVKEVRERMGK